MGRPSIRSLACGVRHGNIRTSFSPSFLDLDFLRLAVFGLDLTSFRIRCFLLLLFPFELSLASLLVPQIVQHVFKPCQLEHPDSLGRTASSINDSRQSLIRNYHSVHFAPSELTNLVGSHALFVTRAVFFEHSLCSLLLNSSLGVDHHCTNPCCILQHECGGLLRGHAKPGQGLGEILSEDRNHIVNLSWNCFQLVLQLTGLL
mmetsp:Transcript_43142/g.113541  ORF Transcript_43142/g.113541 Transcript_43142/m.113541 type:complete len:203 (+) Transcript_43142:59-667(+)